jgi:hypothetical protein
LALLLKGQSFADIDRTITAARRDSAIHEIPLSQILDQLNKSLMDKLDHAQRIDLAASMYKEGLTQHYAHAVTGVSRDTIRRHVESESSDGSRG